MQTSRLRRSLALLASATLLASLTAVTVASPASAAKPKCQGKTATIVGIIGTAKRDVIVAKGGADKIFGRGGNDLICAGAGNDRVVGNAGIDKLIAGIGADTLFGGAGPDRLFGGPGPDTLAGQPGNGVLDGGSGVDTCHQGIGTGPVVRCERPPSDGDGDGITDDTDACPTQGAGAFGLDGTGCPIPAPNDYAAQYVDDGGTYSEHDDFWTVRCDWEVASPYATDGQILDTYLPLCQGLGEYQGFSYDRVSPAMAYCALA